MLISVEAADATSAVASAWQSYRPTESRRLRIVLPQEARNGWDERHAYEYASAPNEKLSVYALAWRADSHWTVTIVEASRATREKYAAGFGLLQESLQPAGFQRETFAGKAAHPLDAERIGLIKDFVTDQMQRFSIPGVGLSLIEGGTDRVRGRLRRQDAGQARSGWRGYAVSRGVRHQGDDDAAARRIGRRRQAALGSAGHGSLSILQAGRHRHHAAGQDPASGLRLHRASAPGPGVAAQLRARDARNRHWRCSGPCSRPAGSARSFNTAT